jgi:hypothetical protein
MLRRLFEPVHPNLWNLVFRIGEFQSRQDLAPSPDTSQIASRPSWFFSFHEGMQNNQLA